MTALLAELKAARDQDRQMLGGEQLVVLAAWSEAISIAERHAEDDDGPYWLGFYRGITSQPAWRRITAVFAAAIFVAFVVGLAGGEAMVR